MNDTITGDPQIAAAIDPELDRQRGQIELIASENIVSRDVLLTGDQFDAPRTWVAETPSSIDEAGCVPERI